MRTIASLALLLACLLPAGRAPAAEGPQPADETRRRIEEAEILFRVRRLILDTYVKQVKGDDLFEGALRGMLAPLDPYSVYLSPDDLKEKQVDIRGRFGGLGIEITVADGVPSVITPLVGTPAFRAGILAGDHILAIDGTPTRNLPIREAIERMRGKPGTTVRLTVLHKGAGETVEIEIAREIIEVKSVRLASILPAPEGAPRIGYISLARFQPDTVDELRKAVVGLEKEGMAALVLDLRLNPGGVLKAAVEVADLFLEEGAIVSTRGRGRDGGAPGNEAGAAGAGGGGEDRLFRAHKLGTRPDYPVAILVNAGSASASEIVAGALRDNDRAILVGEKTYGKGSVQRLMRFDLHGDEAGLLLTTALYYTPSGRCIHEKGIEPDLVVPMPMEDLRQLVLNQRKAWIESNRPREQEPGPDRAGGEGEEGGDEVAPPGEKLPAGGETAGEADETAEGSEPEADPKFHDVQLDRAVDALKAILIDRARRKAA